MIPHSPRPPRLAFLTLPGLGHFTLDLLRALPAPGLLEVEHFEVRRPQDVAAALAWTDDPGRDALWFEFCWPPFPTLIDRTDFAGRRVLMRVHRVEAFDTNHAAKAPWHKVDDVVVVAGEVAQRLREVAPGIDATTRLSLVHNGVDLDRFRPAEAPDPFRIGWCGWLSLRKNPTLALEILHRLRALDVRYSLHIATMGAETVATGTFLHLVERMGLASAVHIIEGIPQDRMPEWHAQNGVLLSTSLHESFGYAIAEAAAVGCDLAVLDFPAAAEFWPEAVRFATVEEAVALIRAARPHRWRRLISERFSLVRQAETIRELLRAPRHAAANAPEATVPIRHGSWEGRFLLRDRTDHIQRVVASSGRFYEAEMLEDLRGRLTPGSLFLDIGANIGNHALFAAGVCDARVLAFEPSAELARHCRDNLALNGLADRAEVRIQGVGDRPGRARLLPGPAGNAGMTRLDLMADAAAEIEVVCLDDAMAGIGLAPSAIKIDVEGMESAVLRGAREMLRHRPAVYVEAATPGAFLEVRLTLEEAGYAPMARFNATPTWLFLPDEAQTPPHCT